MELKYANNKLIARRSGPQARRLSQDHRRLDSRLRLLHRRRHHRTQFQHPLRECQRHRRRHRHQRHHRHARRQRLCDECRPGPAAGEHRHAGGGRRHLLPEADHRPSDLGRRVRFPGHQLLRYRRRRKRAGADPAGGALGDRAGDSGNGHPHLPHSRRHMHRAASYRRRPAGRRAQSLPVLSATPHGRPARPLFHGEQQWHFAQKSLSRLQL